MYNYHVRTTCYLNINSLLISTKGTQNTEKKLRGNGAERKNNSNKKWGKKIINVLTWKFFITFI